MKKTYLNEIHRLYSEACQREVKEMQDHPLTAEEKEEQMRNLRRGPIPVRSSERLRRILRKIVEPSDAFLDREDFADIQKREHE